MVRTVDFSVFDQELLQAYHSDVCEVRGLDQPAADEFMSTLGLLQSLVEATKSFRKVYESGNDDVRVLISDYLDWVFSSKFFLKAGDTVVEASVTEYALVVERDADVEDEEWSQFYNELEFTTPLDFSTAEYNPVYISIPFLGGVAEAIEQSVGILKKAGFSGLANALLTGAVDYQPSVDEVMAGNVLGVLLSGVTPEFAATFQNQALESGLLPVWTSSDSRRTPEEVMGIYKDVVQRLTVAMN